MLCSYIVHMGFQVLGSCYFVTLATRLVGEPLIVDINILWDCTSLGDSGSLH